MEFPSKILAVPITAALLTCRQWILMRNHWLSQSSLALVVVLQACDGDATGPLPRLEIGASHTTTFEAGWGGWTPEVLFLPRHEAQERLRSDVPGHEGVCAWLESANRTDRVHHWIEHEFIVQEDARLDVAVEFEAGAGMGLETHMNGIGFVRLPGEEPEFVRLGPMGTMDYDPEPRRFAFTREILRSDEARVVTVGVGYHSGFEIRQGVCVDNVRITVT